MNETDVQFTKMNHFWMDSGLIGLKKILTDIEPDKNVIITANDSGIHLHGKEEDIQALLEQAYEFLVENYYNLSSKKQKDDKKNYNFFYDSSQDVFVAFPKRKSYGIADLIYNKAPRPSGGQIKWEKQEKRDIEFDGKTVKKNRGVLPAEKSHLQERLDQFLDSNGLDVTTSGLLLDGPNQVKPEVTIKVKPGKVNGHCYICGEQSHALDYISQTTYPYITGSSGMLNFNSLTGKPEKVCWKCAYIGKFVPVNGFYFIDGDNLFAFFPYSSSFEKTIDVFNSLESTKELDPSLFRNFNNKLGGYFHHVYEVTFAFLYTVFEKVLVYKPTQDEAEQEMDLDEMLGFTLSKAPVEFFVLHAASKGSTNMGKMLWSFKESVYFFRLMETLKRQVDVKEAMRLLIDFDQKNENQTLIRNRVCERILKKQSILDLIEKYCFNTQNRFIKPLFDLTYTYEPIIRKEDSALKKEEQETAVTLGKRIGMTIATDPKGNKGDLFALRKARKKTDFLNELNRLQFRFDLVIPSDLYEGKFTDENFVEFKQFCMISALNSFNAKTASKN